MSQKNAKKQRQLQKLTLATKGVSSAVTAYDAAGNTKKRNSAPAYIQDEDKGLNKFDRSSLIANAWDCYRNSSILQWAVTKHLDFVSSFKLQVKTSNEETNKDIEKLWRWWSDKCDISQRYNFDEMMRLIETQRVCSGDGYIYLDENNVRIGIIQSDCICQPDGQPLSGDWVQGIRIGDMGQITGYAWCERVGTNGRKLKKVIPAKNILRISYSNRYDQYRGISPLASCLNQVRDLDEAKGYLMAKMKAQAQYGIVITRQSQVDINTGLHMGSDNQTSYNVKATDNKLLLDMDRGDDAKLLVSQSPAADVQTFISQMLQQVLKSLDIDIALYNSTLSSFSGNKAAIGLFQISIAQKQKALIKLQKQIFYWVLNQWVDEGILDLPADMNLWDIDFDFIPTTSTDFFDALKDIKQTMLLLAGGFGDFQQFAKQRGLDWKKCIDNMSTQIAYAKEKGVDITLAGVTGTSATNPDLNKTQPNNGVNG